jgi:heterodisulfide reductase subunit D
MTLIDPKIDEIIRKNNLHMCLECGKCSASCPRMLSGKEYSPRLLAQKIITQRDDEAFIENSVWECLTCGLCEERCPSAVDVSEFILEMRALLAKNKGLKGYRAHDGALHSWMRMMTSPDLEQNRMEWIKDEKLKVAKKGKIAFFTGCAPYFDIFFEGIEVDTLRIAKDSVKMLNFLEIEPVVLEQERCCGHDLLWTGDRENFELLCRLNYDELKAAGVEEVVMSCPECYQVFSKDMPEVIPEFDLKITLLMDLLKREIYRGGKSFKPLKRRATYSDPCRLGRGTGRHIEEPRHLLKKIPNLKLKEMESWGKGAMCCGNNGFINCDAYSKSIQITKLKEARATKADLLVTSCPKCMIHLTCAMRDPVRRGSLKMEIKDIISILAEQIEYSG